MTFEQIKEKDNKNIMHTYGRKDLSFESGCGILLKSHDGKEYYDFLSGIAVNVVGHSHPKLVAAIKEQAEKLLHTSNYYYIEPQALLAEKICATTCADRVFFGNSGAEANEGAIKLARMYHYKNGHPEKYKVISLVDSFHGRTLGTLAATGQEKYQKPFRPMMPTYTHVEINNIEALKNAVTEETSAIMLELVQGESGVHPVDYGFVQDVRALCDEKDILLIIDEVQTGMGRTGRLMAHEHYDIKPDIFTLAKALGGGVPIGAVCAKEEIAKYFEPGDHGSTFGGNFIATAAANAVFDIMQEESILENASKMGSYFREQLMELKKQKPIIKEVRGLGLMLGAELSEPIADNVCKALQENGFLIGTVAGKILRFLPPLIVTKEDIDKLIACLSEIL